MGQDPREKAASDEGGSQGGVLSGFGSFGFRVWGCMALGLSRDLGNPVKPVKLSVEVKHNLREGLP